MPPSITVRFGGNLDDLKKALKEGKVLVENTSSSMDKLASKLSGAKAKADADVWVGAIRKIGDATKLTAADQERANKVMERAIAYYKAAGKEVPAEIRKIADATKDAATKHESLGAAVGKNIAAYAAGFATLATAKRLLSEVGQFVGESVTAYAAQETAIKKMTTALVAQGAATPGVVRQNKELASQIQRTTVYSDELILEMQALLVEVGNVAPTEMGKALTAATDLASGLGVDLRTATMLVGKAFAGETGTLKRYGIVLDETELKTKGVAAVLDAVNEKFGGQAAAQLDTYTGRVQSMANAWDDVKESIGKVIATSGAIQGFLADTTRAFQQFADDAERDNLTRAIANRLMSSGVPMLMGQGAALSTLDLMFGSTNAPPGGGQRFNYDISLDPVRSRQEVDKARLAAESARKAADAAKQAAEAAARFRASVSAMPGVYGMPGYMMPAILGEDERLARMQELRNPELPAYSWANWLSAKATPSAGKPTDAPVAPTEASVWAGTLSGIIPTLRSAFEGGGGLSGALQSIGTGVNAGFGMSLMQGPLGQSLATGIQNIFGQKAATLFGQNAGALGGLLGAGTGALGSYLSGKDSGLAKAAGGALSMVGTGAMIGSVIPGLGTAAGAAIGAAVGAIKSLLGKKPGKILGENADKDIANLQAELKSTYGSLDKIRELGKAVGVDLAAAWGDKNVKGLEHFKGLTEDFAKALEQAQTRLDTITKHGLLLDAKSAAFLKTQGPEAIAAFVSGQSARGVSAAQALAGGSITSQGAAAGIGAGVAGIAAQLLESGATPQEMIDQLGPAIDVLREKFAKAGLDGGAAFNEIARQVAYLKDEAVAPLITSAQGAADLMTVLANTGRLDQEAFAGLAQQVSDTAAQLTQAGKGGEEMGRALAPQLQRVWELQQQFGFEVDASTQALIDQGIQAGRVGEQFKGPADKMLSAIDKLVERMGDFIDTILGVPKAVSQIPGSIEIDANVNYQARKGPIIDGAGPDAEVVPAMARGGIVTRPTFALIGEAGPEAVVPLSRLAGAGGTASSPVEINFTISAIDRAGVDDFIQREAIPAIVAATRGNVRKVRTQLRDALGVEG